MKQLYIVVLTFFTVITVTTISSCKKYADPPPYFQQIDTVKANGSRKILLIGIDGAVGSIVKSIAPPTLTAMEQHSKFTYESISDDVTTDAASWKTLLSGVNYNNHKTKDSSFSFTFDGETEHEAIKQYPSLFTNILTSEKPDLTTAIMSPWSNLVNKLTPEVGNSYVAGNDTNIKDSAIKLFKKTNVPSLTVLNFNEPALAGLAGEFAATNAAYKTAILNTDGYVGEILNTIKARPEYNRTEEWLIIVVSTHGGSGNTYGGNTADEVNTFTFIYNEKLKKLELTKEGTLNNPLLSGTGATAVRAVLNNTSAYDLSAGPITYQFKIKGSNDGSYPVFFSKRGPESGNTIRSNDPGFALIASGSGIQNFIRGTSSTSPGAGKPVTDNTWHDVALTFGDSSTRRVAKIYIDGGLYSYADITGQGSSWGAFKSPFPLTFGYKQGDFVSTVKANYVDIKVFDMALSQADIQANLCVQDPLVNHTLKNRIIGYWPCNDGIGGIFKNRAPAGSGKDFILQNNYSWSNITNIPCSFPVSPGPGKLSKLVGAVDVAPLMMYWLGINIKSNWGWNANASWFEAYETEFLE